VLCCSDPTTSRSATSLVVFVCPIRHDMSAIFKSDRVGLLFGNMARYQPRVNNNNININNCGPRRFPPSGGVTDVSIVICIVSRWQSLADSADFPFSQLAQIDLFVLTYR